MILILNIIIVLLIVGCSIYCLTVRDISDSQLKKCVAWQIMPKELKRGEKVTKLIEIVTDIVCTSIISFVAIGNGLPETVGKVPFSLLMLQEVILIFYLGNMIYRVTRAMKLHRSTKTIELYEKAKEKFDKTGMKSKDLSNEEFVKVMKQNMEEYAKKHKVKEDILKEAIEKFLK